MPDFALEIGDRQDPCIGPASSPVRWIERVPVPGQLAHVRSNLCALIGFRFEVTPRWRRCGVVNRASAPRSAGLHSYVRQLTFR